MSDYNPPWYIWFIIIGVCTFLYFKLDFMSSEEYRAQFTDREWSLMHLDSSRVQTTLIRIQRHNEKFNKVAQ